MMKNSPYEWSKKKKDKDEKISKFNFYRKS